MTLGMSPLWTNEKGQGASIQDQTGSVQQLCVSDTKSWCLMPWAFSSDPGSFLPRVIRQQYKKGGRKNVLLLYWAKQTQSRGDLFWIPVTFSKESGCFFLPSFLLVFPCVAFIFGKVNAQLDRFSFFTSCFRLSQQETFLFWSHSTLLVREAAQD